MTILRVFPIKLSGELTIPPSKSHTLRALVFALMAHGKSVIHGFLPSPDTEAMVRAISLLGGSVRRYADVMEVEGVGGMPRPADDVVHAGNSGIVLRFIGALAALSSTYTVITGDHSIRHSRPAQPLIDGLNQLGAFAVSSCLNGHAPLVVRGPMRGGEAVLSGEDSQPISALLIAASFVSQKTTLYVRNPGEKPWIDMTVHWMKKLGMHVRNYNYEKYELEAGARYDGFETVIPGDLSSLAYPVAAALITHAQLTVHGVDMSDVQGDKKFIDILISMGAHIEIDSERKILRICGGKNLRGVHVDINECIDMITILPVVACFAEGETRITGARIARVKESDRIAAITSELKKMGACIEEMEEGIIVHGGPLTGARMQSYADHRIALALSVAALGAQGESQIEGAFCIAKTYPHFQADFCSLGAHIL